jgi:hypothetical protein
MGLPYTLGYFTGIIKKLLKITGGRLAWARLVAGKGL